MRNVSVMKRNGASSDDGMVFICDRCNHFATDLHKMQDDISDGYQSSAGD